MLQPKEAYNRGKLGKRVGLHSNKTVEELGHAQRHKYLPDQLGIQENFAALVN